MVFRLHINKNPLNVIELLLFYHLKYAYRCPIQQCNILSVYRHVFTHYKCTISNLQPTRLAKGTDPSRFLALELMKTKSHSTPVSIIMWTRNYR